MFTQDEFDTLYPQLVRFFVQHGGRGNSEDWASETMERCVRAWKRGQLVSSGYAIYAAKSVLVDHARRGHLAFVPDVEDYEQSYELKDVNETPPWFDKLPKRYQTLVMLLAAGCSYQEAGAYVGLKKGAVRRRVHTIRALAQAS